MKVGVGLAVGVEGVKRRLGTLISSIRAPMTWVVASLSGGSMRGRGMLMKDGMSWCILVYGRIQFEKHCLNVDFCELPTRKGWQVQGLKNL